MLSVSASKISSGLSGGEGEVARSPFAPAEGGEGKGCSNGFVSCALKVWGIKRQSRANPFPKGNGRRSEKGQSFPPKHGNLLVKEEVVLGGSEFFDELLRKVMLDQDSLSGLLR